MGRLRFDVFVRFPSDCPLAGAGGTSARETCWTISILHAPKGCHSSLRTLAGQIPAFPYLYCTANQQQAENHCYCSDCSYCCYCDSTHESYCCYCSTNPRAANDIRTSPLSQRYVFKKNFDRFAVLKKSKKK